MTPFSASFRNPPLFRQSREHCIGRDDCLTVTYHIYKLPVLLTYISDDLELVSEVD